MSDVVGLFKFTIDAQEFTLPLHNEFSLGMTPREWMRIESLLGRPVGIEDFREAMVRGHYPTIIAAAIVAADRSGATLNADALLDGKCDFRFTYDGLHDDHPPPAAAGAEAEAA